MTDIGYLLPTRESVMGGAPDPAPLLALAERAEALAYRSVWVGDSIVAKPRHEPLTILAAAAARTSQVQLGTAVLLPALRDPVVLAHLVTTVDLLSAGRLILGIGMAADTPANRAEFAAVGVPYERRGNRMDENLDVCRALWTTEAVTRTGDLYPLDDVQMLPAPHTAGGPPIWAAGGGPISIRRAAERYDGWFPIGANQEKFVAGVAQVTELAEAAGRPRPTIAMYLTVSVDDDQAKAESTLEDFLGDYYSAPGAAVRKMQATVAGPLDAVAEGIASWASAGADHLVLRFVGDHERHLEQLASTVADLA